MIQQKYHLHQRLVAVFVERLIGADKRSSVSDIVTALRRCNDN
jgi:hypothetical protein